MLQSTQKQVEALIKDHITQISFATKLLDESTTLRISLLKERADHLSQMLSAVADYLDIEFVYEKGTEKFKIKKSERADRKK
jgi:hypothetical protein